MMDVERPSLCNCVVNFLLEEKYHLTAFELLHELLEDGRHDQAIRLRDSDRQIQLPQRNIVSTVNLDFKLDLKSIALQARNAEYNPKEGNRRKCNEEKKAVVLTYIGRCCVHLSLHRSSVNPTFTSAQILGLYEHERRGRFDVELDCLCWCARVNKSIWRCVNDQSRLSRFTCST